MVYVIAAGTREAVEILHLRPLPSSSYGGDDDYLNLLVIFLDTLEDTSALWLDRFVTAVEQNRRLQKLGLWYYGVFFRPQDDDGDVDAVERRLFGNVLSSHQTLTCLRWSNCRIRPECVELFAASFAASVNANTHSNLLESLTFSYTPLDLRGAVALGNLLRANKKKNTNNLNAQGTGIRTLFLESCDIQSQGFEALLEALNDDGDGDDDHVSHLRELELHHNNISQISPKGARALGRSMSLRSLTIRDAALTVSSIRTLVEGLKTNWSLEVLSISCCGSHLISLEEFEELVTTFNFALRQVWIGDNGTPSFQQQQQQRINALVGPQLNERIRTVHSHLQGLNYHIPQPSLWPHVLGCISSKPSLVYHFMRRGNVNFFAKSHLVVVESDTGADDYDGHRERL